MAVRPGRGAVLAVAFPLLAVVLVGPAGSAAAGASSAPATSSSATPSPSSSKKAGDPRDGSKEAEDSQDGSKSAGDPRGDDAKDGSDGSGGSGASGDDGDQQPTAEEVAAAQARARAALEVARSQSAVDDAQAALDTASAAASLALEQYSGALVASRTAQLEADRQDQLLLQAQLTLAAQKAVIGRWAREAYGDDTLGSNPALVTILEGGTTDDLSRATMYLRHVGNSKGRAVEEYTQALRDQAAAASAAEAAQAAAQDAANAAKAAKDTSDAAVAAQRDALAVAEARLATAQDAAAAADLRASNLAAARAMARSRSAGTNQVTGDVGDCRGADTSVYANGEIPISALCPLWGTAGQYLRADAAYAFNRLSQAYAQDFGEPICVTDSYRDYETQVRLRREKPTLAAVPGTSNHGWGTATDLCGGIQDFGTPTHRWMLRHATEYGWFHPAWAEPSGSKPEPWHWEYAG